MKDIYIIDIIQTFLRIFVYGGILYIGIRLLNNIEIIAKYIKDKNEDKNR